MVLRPIPKTVVSGIIIYLVICIGAYLTWKASTILIRFHLFFQIVGHIIGLLIWFITLASVYYLLEVYSATTTSWENWKSFLLEQLGSRTMQYNLEYITAVSVFYIINYIHTIREKENEKTHLAIANNEMRLSLLKSQINPHFLFNTLNSISTLMTADKTRARQMMTMLSDVLRYALDSNSVREVPLIDELNFIRNYINIQQVRFGHRLAYQEDIDQQCMKLRIPPMVLQPLVENSVKHGITPKEEGGKITLLIKRQNGQADFEVSDDGVGLTGKDEFESSNSGVGLINSDKRLQNMYGRDSKINIAAGSEGFTVHFSIPMSDG